MKGHLKSRGSNHHSNKLNTKSVRKPKQKLKNHKGLLKRVKIVAFCWFRLVPDGIESSNSNPQERIIYVVTKAEQTCSEKGRLVTCTKQICSRSKSWFLTSRENRWKWDIDIYWLVCRSHVFGLNRLNKRSEVIFLASPHLQNSLQVLHWTALHKHLISLGKLLVWKLKQFYDIFWFRKAFVDECDVALQILLVPKSF